MRLVEHKDINNTIRQMEIDMPVIVAPWVIENVGPIHFRHTASCDELSNYRGEVIFYLRILSHHFLVITPE